MRGVLLLVVLAACGGGSGIEESKLIVDLSDSELDDLCDYVVEQQGTATKTCTDDETEEEYEVEFPNKDECVDYFLSYGEGCGATVRQEEECAEKLGDSPCSDPTACHAADDC